MIAHIRSKLLEIEKSCAKLPQTWQKKHEVFNFKDKGYTQPKKLDGKPPIFILCYGGALREIKHSGVSELLTMPFSRYTWFYAKKWRF